MSSLNGRIKRLEEALELDSDSLNPFTLPQAWEAYGLLLEYGMRQHAANLYTNGRIDELKQLWLDLAKRTPNRTQPKKRQLAWAVDRMPHFIEKWEKEPDWNPPQTYKAIIEDIANGRIFEYQVLYGNGKHAYFELRAADEEVNKRLKYVIGIVSRMAKESGWKTADKPYYKGDVSFPHSPHTLDELTQLVNQIRTAV